eukprot:548312-Pyramimonas_sp.AAC.1
MTIVFLHLRLSAAACYPLLQNFPTLSLPETEQQTALSTYARIEQKGKQKADKEAGIKPRKIPKLVEEGNDDSGDDLKGFGCSSYYTDAPLDSGTDSNGEEETLITLPAG